MNQEEKNKKTKNFRKRNCWETEDGENSVDNRFKSEEEEEEEEEEHRMALEEVKFLQKQRERKAGIPANLAVSLQSNNGGGGLSKKMTDINNKTGGGGGGGGGNKNESVGGGEGDKDDLVLQDTFAQETAVMVEDPNMLKYIELELAKKRGRTVDSTQGADNDLIKQAEDELYSIPEHLKVKRRNSNESSTQWTTGIAEVQLPIEYKLKNIEETEAAKKLLQEKRFMGRSKSEFSIPSSYSADYFHRGRDYAERLRREHPELYKDRSSRDDGSESKPTDTGKDAAGQRQAATDEFMLERFRKRERHRGMRR